MSTNYYAHTPSTPAGEEGLHIGQHAAGREFLFRAHPELGLTTVKAWHAHLSRPGVAIVAEDGVVETPDAFWKSATRRQADLHQTNEWDCRARPRNSVSWRDPDARGVPFADYEFC